MSGAKFHPGQLVATPNALASLSQEEIMAALSRHVQGDWGNLDHVDWAENENALTNGTRLFSVYQSASKVTFWIITEADRSVTTVLLPKDY